MVQAFRRLQEAGQVTRIPIKDQVAAVGVGIVKGEVLLDLTYAEDAAADVDMNVVMPGSGDLVEVQGSAEEGAFSRQQMDQMLDVAWNGIQEVHKAQILHLGGKKER